MIFLKTIFFAVLVYAIAAYAFDALFEHFIDNTGDKEDD